MTSEIERALALLIMILSDHASATLREKIVGSDELMALTATLLRRSRSKIGYDLTARGRAALAEIRATETPITPEA